MEGIGSRLGRASSRYGPAATVFNGPVRKWKKKWVHVSSASTVSYLTPSQSQPNGHKLLLCRWTPILTTTSASATEGDGSSGGAPDEPPRRKFRYTPIAVLEEQKRDNNQYTARTRTISDEVQVHRKLNAGDVFEQETQGPDKKVVNLKDANFSSLDLDLCLNGQSGNPDSVA